MAADPHADDPPVVEAEIDEIIPPAYAGKGATRSSPAPGPKGSRLSRSVAWLLDEVIRLPGTKFRFGLDPIIGLVPGGGETVSSLLGCAVLAESVKRGIPVRILLKMSGNTLLNAAIGVIPVAGDLFSVWFKSNTRNYGMLRSWLEREEGAAERGAWWPLIIIFGVIGIVAVLNILTWIVLLGVLNSLVGLIGG